MSTQYYTNKTQNTTLSTLYYTKKYILNYATDYIVLHEAFKKFAKYFYTRRIIQSNI